MSVTKIDGFRQITFTGNLSLMDRDGSTMRKIVNLADPTSNQDGATKLYVDTQDGSVRSDLTSYVDTQDGSVRSDLTSYVDTQDGSVRSDLTSYVDTQDGSVRSDLTSYVDAQDGSVRSDLTSYVDAQDGSVRSDLTAYANSIASGLDVKQSVDAAIISGTLGTHTYNGTSGTNGVGRITGIDHTFGGVILVNGDRILVACEGSGTSAKNGIWQVISAGTGDNGTWDRPSDFDNTPSGEVTDGAFTFVERGTNASKGYTLITNDPITLDGTAGTGLTWTQFSAATTVNFVTREVPTGTVNGTNQDFTLANTPVSGSESAYLNGLIQNVGGSNDYTIASAVVHFNAAPVSGDVLLVSYQYNA